MAFHKAKLSRDEVEKIFFRLCFAIAEMKSPKEVAEFIRDILSFQEAEMVAKRLMIAEMILKNCSYDEIRSKLKVSNGTISRVQVWLKLSGEGYRRAINLTERKKFEGNMPIEKFSEWNSIKKRYPMYFWPQLLLEELIQNSSKRQKDKIKNVLREIEKSKKKTALFKRIAKIINYRKPKLAM